MRHQMVHSRETYRNSKHHDKKNKKREKSSPRDLQVMPVENLEQPVVLRTDREAGMALVKSKDGRIKWLTVSADPSSPSPSWEERVRRWASRLGVCALPSPTKKGNQGTPLSTPPPLDPQHLHHWVSAESGNARASISTRDVRAAGPSPEAGLSLPSPPPPPSPIEHLKSDKTKQKARLKRPGSFTRGFLLGLGGGGGGCSTFRSKSPTKADHVSDGEAKEGVADPASIAGSTLAQLQPVQLCPANRQDDVQGCRRVEHVKSGVDQVNTAVDTSSVVVSLSGRERWVKGAPLSPTASDSSCEGEGHGEGEGGGDDGSSDSNGENSCVQGGSRIGKVHVDVDDNGGVTPAADKDMADLDGDGNGDEDDDAWLETASGSIYRSNSHSNDGSTGRATKAKSKKKKTKGSKGGKGSKAKGKGSKAKASKASLANPACTTPESNKDAAEASTSTSSKGARKEKGKNAPNVTFGDVSLVEFTRDVGGCAVPSEGTWALALGLPFRETRVDVDGYETSKAEILAERASKLSKKQRHLATGETRQFDYRPVGERNPLFYRLDEKERSKRLLEYACFHKSDLDEADKDDHHAAHDMEDRGDSDELDAFSHKVSHSEFVDKSQEAAAELAVLRKGRRSSQGCSCTCIRADKLNVAKLKGELSKRGLKASGSKKELTKMLRDAMQREEEEQGGQGRKVCRSDDCQCVMDGVGCHADLCNCCKGPNIGKRDLHHGGNCGNPEGVYAYSSSAVRAYRESYVTAKTVPAQERWHPIHHTT